MRQEQNQHTVIMVFCFKNVLNCLQTQFKIQQSLSNKLQIFLKYLIFLKVNLQT